MSKKTYEMVLGIIKYSPATYCPINAVCNIRLVDGIPESVHRVSNGGGTVLKTWEGKLSVFEIIKESGNERI